MRAFGTNTPTTQISGADGKACPFRASEGTNLRKCTIVRSGEDIVNGLRRRDTFVVVCRILICGRQSGAGAAVGADEDGVALDELPVGAVEGLLDADVAGRFDVLAVVSGDVDRCAFRQASAVCECLSVGP